MAEVQAEIETTLKNEKQKAGIDGFNQAAHTAYNEIYFPKLPAATSRPGQPAGPRAVATPMNGPRPTVRPAVTPAPVQPQPAPAK